MGTKKNSMKIHWNGNVGGVVGFMWKGREALRSMAQNVRQPNTEAQLAQRMRFTLVAHLISSCRAMVNVGFKKVAAANQNSEYAQCMGYNIKNATTGTYPAISIDYDQVLLSMGSLPSIFDPRATATQDHEVHLTWIDNSMLSGAAATDHLNVCIHNITTGDSVVLNSAAARADTIGDVPYPALWAGDTAAVYVAFSNANDDCSDSFCVTHTLQLT